MQRKILAASVTLALLLTTACSLNIGGDRLNLSGDVSTSEKADQTGDNENEGKGLSFTGGISFDKGTYLTEEQNIASSAAGIEKLDISDTAGNISIKPASSGDIVIKAIKKVKGTNEELKKEVMNNIDIIVESTGGKLSVHPATKDGKKDDLWSWAEHYYKGVQVTVDFELAVPENVKVFTVKNNAGNISLSDITGEIGIRNNAGNITMNGVYFTGSSDIQINAGSIDIDSDVSKAAKLNIVNTAGNILLKLPESSGFDLSARITAGNIGGSFLSGTHIISGSYKHEINGGGADVSVTSVAGNVTIDSK